MEGGLGEEKAGREEEEGGAMAQLINDEVQTKAAAAEQQG